MYLLCFTVDIILACQEQINGHGEMTKMMFG